MHAMKYQIPVINQHQEKSLRKLAEYLVDEILGVNLLP